MEKLIIGCASTGAKFTSNNHRRTGDAVLDSICTGATILTSVRASIAEVEAFNGMGCRYYDYQEISRAVQRRCADILIRFGASRNGNEVREDPPVRGMGRGQPVRRSAAVELQVICELERQ